MLSYWYEVKVYLFIVHRDVQLFQDHFLVDDLSLLTHSASVVVHLLSHVQLFVTPWTAARQASLFFTISWSLLKFMSIELVMLSNHLILCNPRLLLSPISHVLSISESRHPMFLSFKILKGAKLKLKESYISQSKSFHIFPHPNSAKAANWNFAEKNHLDAFHFLNNVQS